MQKNSKVKTYHTRFLERVDKISSTNTNNLLARFYSYVSAQWCIIMLEIFLFINKLNNELIGCVPNELNINKP